MRQVRILGDVGNVGRVNSDCLIGISPRPTSARTPSIFPFVPISSLCLHMTSVSLGFSWLEELGSVRHCSMYWKWIIIENYLKFKYFNTAFQEMVWFRKSWRKTKEDGGGGRERSTSRKILWMKGRRVKVVLILSSSSKDDLGSGRRALPLFMLVTAALSKPQGFYEVLCFSTPIFLGLGTLVLGPCLPQGTAGHGF